VLPCLDVAFLVHGLAGAPCSGHGQPYHQSAQGSQAQARLEPQLDFGPSRQGTLMQCLGHIVVSVSRTGA
jgi:hypothetical protein